jgi:hypothetical protein
VTERLQFTRNLTQDRLVGKIFNSYPNLILFPVKPNEVATFFGKVEKNYD